MNKDQFVEIDGAFPAMHPLIRTEIVEAFKQVTGGFHDETAAVWEACARTGLSDDDLAEFLRLRLGILGGYASPGKPYITYQGAGLKIWITRQIHNHVQEPPLFAGRTTIAMAREVYGIPDPEDDQLCLL